jgi:hypothetical protein
MINYIVVFGLRRPCDPKVMGRVCREPFNDIPASLGSVNPSDAMIGFISDMRATVGANAVLDL